MTPDRPTLPFYNLVTREQESLLNWLGKEANRLSLDHMTVPKLNPDSLGMRKYAWVYLGHVPTSSHGSRSAQTMLKVEGSILSHKRIKQSRLITEGLWACLQLGSAAEGLISCKLV